MARPHSTPNSSSVRAELSHHVSSPAPDLFAASAQTNPLEFGHSEWEQLTSQTDIETAAPFLAMQSPLGTNAFHFAEIAGTSATSPSMASEIAFISGVNSSGTIAATSFLTWDGDKPATYSGPSQVAKWGGPSADSSGGTVLFFFKPSSDWTSKEKAAFTAGLTLWSDMANIKFAVTTDSTKAQIIFVRGTDDSAYETGSSTGGGTIGSSTIPQMTKATVSIDTSVPGFGPIGGSFSEFGGYAWETLEHEEAHAIGLGHAGPYNGNVNPNTQQYSAYDVRLWSIMSYIDPSQSAKYASQYPAGTSWGTSSGGGGNDPTTMMSLDILAIQSLYGPSTSSVLSGGQTFGFNCNVAGVTEKFFDFTVNTTPIVTLWDAGTGNTLDLSGFSSASKVNLNPGTFSSCDGLVNNICIAFNTKIDTADGGSGNDKFIGNNEADTLNGGAGSDRFSFGGNFTAADRINGGAGRDTLILNGNYAAGVTFADATMTGVEKIVLANGHSYSLTTADANVVAGQTLTVDGHALQSSTTLTFNGSKETNGNFVIEGGAGNDTLIGGAGADHITGGLGADIITGGGGADIFVFTMVADSTSMTYDTITDFDAATNKLDLWFTPSGVAAALNTGTLDSFAFDTDLAKYVKASILPAHDAVLFTPNAGDLKGQTFLIVDVNGTAGYQAGADLVIDLSHLAHASSFGIGNFI